MRTGCVKECGCACFRFPTSTSDWTDGGCTSARCRQGEDWVGFVKCFDEIPGRWCLAVRPALSLADGGWETTPFLAEGRLFGFRGVCAGPYHERNRLSCFLFGSSALRLGGKVNLFLSLSSLSVLICQHFFVVVLDSEDSRCFHIPAQGVISHVVLSFDWLGEGFTSLILGTRLLCPFRLPVGSAIKPRGGGDKSLL